MFGGQALPYHLGEPTKMPDKYYSQQKSDITNDTRTREPPTTSIYSGPDGG